MFFLMFEDLVNISIVLVDKSYCWPRLVSLIEIIDDNVGISV